MTIRSLCGNEPHPDHGGWENFLQKCCEVRGECQGVTYYGTSNCNYIVFPDGTLVENFGFWGNTLMREVAERGPDAVLADIRKRRQEVVEILKSFGVQK